MHLLFQSGIVILVTALGSIHGCAPKTNNNNISTEAREYLQEALALLHQKSVKKTTIDWEKFDQEVFRLAQNCKTIEDTYPAIDYAVHNLDDNHSSYVLNNS